MKRKWDKEPTPWTLTEKVFVVVAVCFFLFASGHTVLKFFGGI